MNINNVSRPSRTEPIKRPSDNYGKKKTDSTEKEAVYRQDTYVKKTMTGGETQTGIYIRSRANGTLVQSLMDEQQAQIDSFQKLLRAMIVKQGDNSNLTLLGMNLHVTPEDSAMAAQAIAEGGEYSVDAVATRLMKMAEALSGGDPSKIGALRDAVEKGFKAAGLELGGKLPGICQDTYTEVMKRFDEWEERAAGASLE